MPDHDSKPVPASLRRTWHAIALGILLLSGLTHLFGIAEPQLWGHYGYHTGEYGQRARNCIRHGACVAQNQATGSSRLTPDTYYMHHPAFWVPIVAVATAVFGDSRVVVRVMGVLSSLAALWVLYLGVSTWRGPRVALLAMAMFALSPHMLHYGILIHTEQPAVALGMGALFAMQSYIRAKRGVGWLLLGGICAFLACHTDWVVYLAFAMASVVWFSSAVWGIRRRATSQAGAFGAQALASGTLVGVVVLSAGLHVYQLQRLGLLVDLLASIQSRSAGSAAISEHMWHHTVGALTLPGVVFSVAAVVYGAIKSVFFGQRNAAAAVCTYVLFAFLVYVWMFPSGHSTHNYRWWFAVVPASYFGADFLWDLWQASGKRLGRAGVAVPVLVFLFLLWRAPDALLFSRATGGVGNLPHNSRYVEAAFASAVHDRTRFGDTIAWSSSIGLRRELLYSMDRKIVVVSNLRHLPPQADYAIFESDGPADHPGILRRHRAEVFQHYWLVHLRSSPRARGAVDPSLPDLSVYRLDAGEPDMFWTFFSSWVYPPVHWSLASSASGNRLRTYYGVSVQGSTWDSPDDPRWLQNRINEARRHGQRENAATLLQQLRRVLGTRGTGVQLGEASSNMQFLGFRFRDDIEMLEAYVDVNAEVPRDATLVVRGSHRVDGGVLRLFDRPLSTSEWTPQSVVRVDRIVWSEGPSMMTVGLQRAGGRSRLTPAGTVDLGQHYLLMADSEASPFR